MLDGDTTLTASLLGVVTVAWSVVTYFILRAQDEKRDETEADKNKKADLDHEQALKTVRKQLSVFFVGPMHRLYQ